MVTPFSGGKTDMTAFENLVRLQIKAGTDALIVNGTTGEASTLTDGEMCALVECAKHLTAGKIPVIAGGLIETKAEIYEALSSGVKRAAGFHR